MKNQIFFYIYCTMLKNVIIMQCLSSRHRARATACALLLDQPAGKMADIKTVKNLTVRMLALTHCYTVGD